MKSADLVITCEYIHHKYQMNMGIGPPHGDLCRFCGQDAQQILFAFAKLFFILFTKTFHIPNKPLRKIRSIYFILFYLL